MQASPRMAAGRLPTAIHWDTPSADAHPKQKNNNNNKRERDPLEEGDSPKWRTNTFTSAVGSRSDNVDKPGEKNHRVGAEVVKGECTDPPRTKGSEAQPTSRSSPILPVFPSWGPCRSVSCFEKLNHIEEGSYGSVCRARERSSSQIVALKRIKVNSWDEGCPLAALREIQLLMESRKVRHIVDLREVVVGTPSRNDGGGRSGGELNDVYLVMDFIEHDLKSLQDDMLAPFSTSEAKTLVMQLASAVAFLHDHWILHRDIKTSNILLNNRGEVKLADFGMARRTSDPPPSNLTQLVVTLWYRAPELLLGSVNYDFAIDIWSLGCVLAEILNKEPLLKGKNESDQLKQIFTLMGAPKGSSWPGYSRLPGAQVIDLAEFTGELEGVARTTIPSRMPYITSAGVDLLCSLLSLDPKRRPTADIICKHPYFSEAPLPKNPAIFPTFPSRAEQQKRRKGPNASPPLSEQIREVDGPIRAPAELETQYGERK